MPSLHPDARRMTSTSHLSPEQRVLLANLLQSQLSDLARERQSRMQGLSVVDFARQSLLQDADDAPQRAGEHELEGIVSEREHSEFVALGQALERVHRAEYGLCVDCQAPIPFNRLRLEPQTLRCVACQTRDEKKSIS